jgi:hypothetical protein
LGADVETFSERRTEYLTASHREAAHERALERIGACDPSAHAAEARAETAITALEEIAALDKDPSLDDADLWCAMLSEARRALATLTQQPQQGQKDDQ